MPLVSTNTTTHSPDVGHLLGLAMIVLSLRGRGAGNSSPRAMVDVRAAEFFLSAVLGALTPPHVAAYPGPNATELPVELGIIGGRLAICSAGEWFVVRLGMYRNFIRGVSGSPAQNEGEIL
jgi:hypothetical protein